MDEQNNALLVIGQKAKKAGAALALTTLRQRNDGLKAMAAALQNNCEAILAANRLDLERGRSGGMASSLLDRLALDDKRVLGMAQGLLDLVALDDPIGFVDKSWVGAQDINIQRLRVPLGVAAVIYEARPNVTTDIAGIALKTGNAVILRGSSSALNSNICLAAILRRALTDRGLPEDAVQLIEDPDREVTAQLMRLNRYVDLIIPRGGAGLIDFVVANSTVPVIETGTGNCHIYLQASGDIAMARDILLNAKCQRPAVCNAAESLLVDQAIAPQALPVLAQALKDAGVELRGCAATLQLVDTAIAAVDSDYDEEFLRPVISCKVVDGTDEAIAWINRHGTRHSEAIITEDEAAAERFLKEVDAACCYVNASSRFTDGGQFGFGAEIGISTQKLHVRGPMGLEAMTTYKYLIRGNGQIRK